MNEPRFSRNKHPLLKIVQPDYITTGKVIVGWWIFDPPSGCCTFPDPTNLSAMGWISSGILLIFFWPLMCMPCFLSGCYEGYQIPIYSDSVYIEPSAPYKSDSIPIAYPINK
jgi:hypothetical protein